MADTNHTHPKPEDFKLENLQKFFEACLQEDGQVNMDNYILGTMIIVN